MKVATSTIQNISFEEIGEIVQDTIDYHFSMDYRLHSTNMTTSVILGQIVYSVLLVFMTPEREATPLEIANAKSAKLPKGAIVKERGRD